MGREKYGNRYPPWKREEALRLRRERVGTREIAHRLEVGQSTVWYWCQMAGLSFRRSPGMRTPEEIARQRREASKRSWQRRIARERGQEVYVPRRPGRQPLYGPEIAKQLIERRQAGATTAELAAELGISARRITALCLQAGYRERKPRKDRGSRRPRLPRSLMLPADKRREIRDEYVRLRLHSLVGHEQALARVAEKCALERPVVEWAVGRRARR